MCVCRARERTKDNLSFVCDKSTITSFFIIILVIVLRSFLNFRANEKCHHHHSSCPDCLLVRLKIAGNCATDARGVCGIGSPGERGQRGDDDVSFDSSHPPCSSVYRCTNDQNIVVLPAREHTHRSVPILCEWSECRRRTLWKTRWKQSSRI
jgi:hypothetical protein